MSVENLQKIVGFGLQIGECVMSAMEATTSIGKATAMLPLLEDMPALMGVDFAALKAEVSQLQPADLDALNAYIDSNFSIPDADKQAKIEAAVSVVIDLAKVAEKAADMFKAKPAAAPAP